VLIAGAGVHALAAIVHHVILRDATLLRMLPVSLRGPLTTTSTGTGDNR
jgi:cytochrome b561